MKWPFSVSKARAESKDIPENSLECITGKDGAEMVLIPAGEFQMGRDDGSYSEKPAHTVYLDAFYMDQYEVTNARYAACVDTGRCDRPKNIRSSTRNKYYGDSAYDDYPVIYVDWDDARVYCAWRGQICLLKPSGRRLAAVVWMGHNILGAIKHRIARWRIS